MKISIIGAGMVGSHSAFLLAKYNVASEIVLVDVDENRAKAEALDIAQSMVNVGNYRVKGGKIEKIKESDIVVITAGVKQRVGEKREELKERNEEIMSEIVENIIKYAPKSVVVVATNPLDEMVEFVKNKLCGEENLVFGTGTELDSYRFRYFLGKYLGVAPKSIRADVWGEHNEKAKFLWDGVFVGGERLEDFVKSRGIEFNDEEKKKIEFKVINSAFEIIKGKGATYFAISCVILEILKAICDDERVVFNLSCGKEGAKSFVI